MPVTFQDIQAAAKHIKFVEENKSSWKQVRVFDSDATGPVAR